MATVGSALATPTHLDTMNQLKRRLRKIAIIGGTGAGKTTLLKEMFGVFPDTDVRRNINAEEANEVGFTAVNKRDYTNSTTTRSMNVIGGVVGLTRFNSTEFMSWDDATYKLQEDAWDTIYPLQFVDIAGQDRFDFMQEIAIRGAHGVLLVVDGTNIASISQVARHFDLICQERARSGRKIPFKILLNKSDLAKKGYYIGASDFARMASVPPNLVHETTAANIETMISPMRELLGSIPDAGIEGGLLFDR